MTKTMASVVTACPKYGMNIYGIGLATAIDKNVRVFYKRLLSNTAELADQCIDFMLHNGLHQPVI
ncbi:MULTISPECIES: hypothetical protein [Paraliobacillus]|nr:MULTISPECIES: hypothetical protein [Paraliobacillus]